MSLDWKLRHEQNNGFYEWEAPKFTGFSSPNEEFLAKQNELFLTTNLKEWIKPFLNKHSSVQCLSENGVKTIKVIAVKCCEKGMYESSKEMRYNYSNDYDSLPDVPEFPKHINEAQELATVLGIEYRN